MNSNHYQLFTILIGFRTASPTIIIYDLLIKMNVCIYSAVVKNFRIGDHSSEPTDFMAQILLLCF